MSDKLTLPSIVRIHQVILLLNLDALPFIKAIESIFDYAQDESLKLHFDTDLIAIKQEPSNDLDLNLSNKIPDRTKLIDQSKSTIINGRKSISLYCGNENTLQDNGVIIGSFIHYGNLYFTENENEYYHPEIPYDELYCESQDLLAILTPQSIADTKETKIKPKIKKPRQITPKQEKRDEAINQPLETITPKQITDDSQYQELIRISKVTKLTGLSKSYIYQLQNQGEFPKSVQIIPNGSAKAWILSEVQDWIKSRIEARNITSS